MRIAVGGIEHESCSFISEPTSREAFRAGSIRGSEFEKLGDANNIIDGLVQGVRETGLEMVPLHWAYAGSGGCCSEETYRTLKEELLAPLRKALPVDGVLLTLHGSFATQGLADADGDILGSVRNLVGPLCPILAVHDLHSNISNAMVQSANALIVERTYPHIDMAERGLEAARLMSRIVHGEVRPTMGFRSLPLFWAGTKMLTAMSPMIQAMNQLSLLLEHPGVLTASISVGYQWADGPATGASTIVVTDGDARASQELADSLALWIWDRRAIWQQEPLTPERALEMGERTGRYPIILADQADNTGGGAPGDSTEILRMFFKKGLREAAVLYMVDPETVAAAWQAGVGATIQVRAGGKSNPLLGPPVPMIAEVLALSDGQFIYDGPMWAGRHENLGRSALLRQGGISVIFISEMRQPIDLAFARSMGLDCRSLRYISVKSTGHFRSGFGPIAGSIFNVDAAGLLTHDYRRLPYKRLGRKVYPLDLDAKVDWPGALPSSGASEAAGANGSDA